MSIIILQPIIADWSTPRFADNSEIPHYKYDKRARHVIGFIGDWLGTPNTQSKATDRNLYNESRKKFSHLGFTGVASIHTTRTLLHLARDGRRVILSLVHCPTGTILQSVLWWRVVRLLLFSALPSPPFSFVSPGDLSADCDFRLATLTSIVLLLLNTGWYARIWPQGEDWGERRG